AFENAVAHAQAVQRLVEPGRGVAAGGTMGVSAPAPSAALPFHDGPRAPAELPPGCPDLTLPQYASLRVELQLYPEHRLALLARYGVAAEAHDALDAHWRARFDADPVLRAEFMRGYAVFLGWVRRGSPAA